MSRIDLGILDDDARAELEMFVALVERSDDFIAMARLDGRVIYLNPAGRRLVGLDEHADVSSHRISDYLTEDGLKQSLEVEQPAVRDNGQWHGVSTLKHFATGEAIDVSINSFLVTHPVTKRPLALATVQRDIREVKSAETALRDSGARLTRILSARGSLADLAQRAITERSSDVIPAAIRDLTALLGGGVEVAVVRDARDAPDAHARQLVEHALREQRAVTGSEIGLGDALALAVPAPVPGEPAVVVIVRDGVPRDFDFDERNWIGLIAIIIAASLQRESVEGQLRFEALHDALTGLPNRTLLLDRLRHALDRSRRARTPVAVMLLDLDDFKWINDSFGHLAGDAALTGFGTHLQESARANDTVGRFGGDEFLVIMEDVSRESDVVAIAERMRAAWAEPVTIAGRELFLSASAGIAIARTDRFTDAPQLLREADQAMYRAKRRRSGTFEVYAADTTEATPDRLRIAGDLRDAIANDRLHLVYQPILSCRDGSLNALEALCRWQHDELGAIDPATFVPIAEESDLIVPLGKWVLRQACAAAARWRGDGYPVSVEINVSPHELARTEYPQDVADALRESGVSAESLGIEIPESALVGDTALARRVLERLRAIGVRLLFDDFGAGASSFTSLQTFHEEFDAVKIDRQFISGITTATGDAGTVEAVMRIGNAFGIPVVAEGVETAIQQERVRALGCEFAQGWHCGVPVAEDAVRTLFTGTARKGRKGTAAPRAESER